MDALLEPVAEPLRRFGYDGGTLRRMREARGLTQAALALLVGWQDSEFPNRKRRLVTA